MLNEEEKKSIEVINEKIEDINNMTINTKNKSTIKFLVEVQKVANEVVGIANEIIIRQQKEIERLNGIINSRYYHDLKCRELEIETNKNWKDKIREKQEQLMEIGWNDKEERQMQNFAYDILKQLLEENTNE